MEEMTGRKWRCNCAGEERGSGDPLLWSRYQWEPRGNLPAKVAITSGLVVVSVGIVAVKLMK